ncbi:MAG TPA: NAD(P)H-hydrate dehydratase [Mycobacteriales bacterium]|nr:NAD(P)H-hydrate dehydratase [Mycobacteriales bacterium]
MRAAHRVEQIRRAEASLAATLPAGTLMQRAATALATVCAARLPAVYGAQVVLLVGGGDNGADALWAGSRLSRRGAQVRALLAGQPAADALAAFLASGGTLGSREDLEDADLVVDGLVGIGGHGPLRGEAAELAAAALGPDVVAVDLPSGVDADTGAVDGTCVHAAVTVTFGTLKTGLLVGEGRRRAGTVHVADIGLGPHLPAADVEVLSSVDAALLLPRAGSQDDKYSRGVVGVMAGSAGFPGAAVLAVGGAVRAGAGMVRFAGSRDIVAPVLARWPEAVAAGGRVQAWVVGPGLGTEAVDTVHALLREDVPVVVDADALTICAEHSDWVRQRTAPTLLTPHDREFARFGVDVGPDRVQAARTLAADLGSTVLLKGDAVVVADPDGAVRINDTGVPALATAGSGDVLAGAAGALLAAGLRPLDAGSLAAHLHGRAGRLASRGAPIAATDLLAAWAEAVRETSAGTLPA